MRARISAVSVIWLGVVRVQMELLGPARAPVSQPGIQWRHLSSANGDLPVPGESKEQTAAIVADPDRDGVKDFVLGFGQKARAFVWYRRKPTGWSWYVIEKEFLRSGWRGLRH